MEKNGFRYTMIRDWIASIVPQPVGDCLPVSRSPFTSTEWMRKRAVPCLEAWLREGKDLRQKLPVLSGYMGHAILKSTEQYLRLIPGRFVKSLSSLQAPPIRLHTSDRTTTTQRVAISIPSGSRSSLQDRAKIQHLLLHS
jgi:hypothetical protein